MNRRTGIRLVAAALLLAVGGWYWLVRKEPGPSPFPKPMPLARDTNGAGDRRVPSDAPPEKVADNPPAKVALLKQILESRNDNDPRLDRDFRNLDPATKNALVDFYHRLPVSDANGRGTVVFLLGREITDPRDIAFFDEVLAEKIAKAPPQAEGSLPMELLAAYPQVMAVSALSATRQRTRDDEIRKRAEAQLRIAADNSNAQISSRAKRALRASR